MISFYDALSACGQHPILLDRRVLVLPHGARVLALFPDGQTNLIWTNPALAAADTAKTLLADTGWANLGGDRTWISPEIDTHVTDPSDWSNGYAVPKSVDPADYSVCALEDRSVTLESSMHVYFGRAGANLRLSVRKTVALLDTPPFESRDECVGYRQTCKLTVDPMPGCNARPGLWQILQVPGGGSIRVPVRPGARPRTFFGKPVYELNGERLRCEVRTDVNSKFSLVAGDCCGKMIYRNRIAGRDALVVRTFQVHDVSAYADVSSGAPDDIGHVQQFYVDDGALGGFGEMEYHSPAVEAAYGGTVEESSDVWAVIGTDLDDLTEKILA